MKGGKRTAFPLLALLMYTAFMLYLMLIGRIGTVHYDSYAEYLSGHISLVPLKFIFDYISAVTEKGIYNIELRNITGNTVLFIPFGALLPRCFIRLRKFTAFLLVFALAILTVELAQLFFALGSLDIDDIILNCLGASAGYFLVQSLLREGKVSP